MTADPTESPDARAYRRRILCACALITLAGAAVTAYFLYPIITGA